MMKILNILILIIGINIFLTTILKVFMEEFNDSKTSSLILYKK